MSDFLKTVTGKSITGLGHKTLEYKPHLDDQVVMFVVDGLIARAIYHHSKFKGEKESHTFGLEFVKNLLNDGHFRTYLAPLNNRNRTVTLLSSVGRELERRQFDLEYLWGGMSEDVICLGWGENVLKDTSKR